MNIIDLTGALEAGMWRYEDLFPAFSSEPATSAEEHGFVVQRVTLSTHLGTHTDALGHLVPGGPMIDAMPLASYVGWATVLRPGPSSGLEPIDATRLRNSGRAPRDGDVALIETGWSRHWRDRDFVAQSPFLTLDGAQWLIDRGVRCVGMDTPGLMDPRIDLTPGRRGSDPIVDQVLMEAGLTYIAALTNLQAVTADRPLFVAAPLKLANLDGAPVRAIAIEGLEN